jgi:hypothetical protein
MSARYQAQVRDDGTVVLRYRMGYCKIECNSTTGETIIINDIGDRWIPYQFDEIFGLGEYKKFEKHIVNKTRTPNLGNPHSFTVVIVGNYLPKQAKKDIKAEQPDSKSDLIGKYFK